MDDFYMLEEKTHPCKVGFFVWFKYVEAFLGMF